jgi:hypothetical protein
VCVQNIFSSKKKPIFSLARRVLPRGRVVAACHRRTRAITEVGLHNRWPGQALRGFSSRTAKHRNCATEILFFFSEEKEDEDERHTDHLAASSNIVEEVKEKCSGPIAIDSSPALPLVQKVIRN